MWRLRLIDRGAARRELVTLGTYLGVFPLVYISAITTSYGFYDDYANLANTLRGSNGPALLQQIEWGRPLVAVLLHVAFTLMHGIGDLRYLRLFSILGIAILAWQLNRALIAGGMKRGLALILPILICVMPPFQVFVAWSSAVFNSWGAIGGGIAVWAALRMLSREGHRWRWWLVATVSLTAGLAIYQPGTMVYWTFAAIALFVGEMSLSTTYKRFSAFLAVTVIPFGAEFLLTRLTPLYFEGASAAAQPRAHLVSDVAGKIHWFASEALPNALALADVEGTHSLAVAVGIFIVCGLMLYFSGPVLARVNKVLVAAALLPLSYLPNLAVTESWASHRSLVGLTSLVTLYAGLALCGYARVWKERHEELSITAVAAITAFCVFAAARNVYLGFALPQTLEYRMLRSELASRFSTEGPRIHVIQACWCDSAASLVRYDDFRARHPQPNHGARKQWRTWPFVKLASMQR